MSRRRFHFWLAALPTLMFPVLLGMTLYLVLFALIDRGVITHEILLRYIAGHPVSQVTTAMFLIGLAALLLAVKHVLEQLLAVGRISLPNQSQHRSTAECCDQMIDSLGQLPSSLHKHYLWHRLERALQFIKRNDGADGLDAELRYLTENDAEHKDDRYALVRILIWATPMLGFLGTVLGISEALGSISIGPDNDFQAMMGGLRSSLYVAFDTTALALTFSIILMFVQFLVDRVETQLLAAVEQRARKELAHHFVTTPDAKDPYIKTVEQIGQRVLATTERLVERQSELWKSTIEAAESSWIETASQAQAVVQQSLSRALGDATAELGDKLTQSIEQADQSIAEYWKQSQLAMADAAAVAADNNATLAEQTGALVQACEKIAELRSLEPVIARHLPQLPTQQDLSDVAGNLATAIRLLEFRLAEVNQRAEDARDHKGNRRAA